ncbi:hypothetical protein, partial [Paraburkholderia dinghuensis]|uniref:hypothetical protein n=1 Tax=Paraburkholderia dinghuensis TaxID=2305225 RepID=UPI001C88B0E0
MQIGGAASNAYGDAATRTLNAGTVSGQTVQYGTRANDGVTDRDAPSQDDAVRISPQGYVTAMADSVDLNDDAATMPSD